MMQQTARSGEKAPLFGGRKPLFTQSQLLKLTWPLLVEQFLAVTVGMADTMMVSRCGEDVYKRQAMSSTSFLTPLPRPNWSLPRSAAA